MPLLFGRVSESPLNELRVLKARPYDKKRTNLSRPHLRRLVRALEPIILERTNEAGSQSVNKCGGYYPRGRRWYPARLPDPQDSRPRSAETVLPDPRGKRPGLSRRCGACRFSISTERTVTVLTRAHEQFYSDLIRDLPISVPPGINLMKR